jgi:hypothetical protein
MNRVRQFVSKILLVKSVVFGVLMLLLLIRSFFTADVVSMELAGKRVELASAHGMFVYTASADGLDAIDFDQAVRKYRARRPSAVMDDLLLRSTTTVFGFSWETRPQRTTGRGLELTATAPHWAMILLGSSTAILWLIRRQIRQWGSTPGPTAWCVTCQSEQPTTNGLCERCGGRAVQLNTVPSSSY